MMANELSRMAGVYTLPIISAKYFRKKSASRLFSQACRSVRIDLTPHDNASIDKDMTERVTPIRSPKFRYPTRDNTVLMKLDFEDRDRVWSLWVETGLRVHCMRLSHAANIDEQSLSTAVARMNIGDNVFESMSDPAEDPRALAEQYVDMLLTLASEQPPADCISYLQWRLSESIKDLRRQNDANHLNAG